MLPTLNLTLREPLDPDFALLAAMRRDMSLQALLLTIPDAIDDQAVRAWIARRCNEEGGAFLVIADQVTNIAFGFAQISQVHRLGRFGYGGIALAEAARGMGIGKIAMQLLLEFASAKLGLYKMLLEVRTDNAPAIALY